MNEETPKIPNAFKNMGKVDGLAKKRGRPSTKPPVGDTKESKPAVGKTARKPVGLRGINKAPTREGYRRRWVNDTEDRVQMFIDGGYAHVKDENGDDRVRRAGSGISAYLMEIDETLYNDDQESKFAKWNKDNQERLKPRDGAGYYQPRTKV